GRQCRDPCGFSPCSRRFYPECQCRSSIPSAQSAGALAPPRPPGLRSPPWPRPPHPAKPRRPPPPSRQLPDGRPALPPPPPRPPLLASPVLDARTGGKVFLKAETLQRTGSFKFRGAYNKISSLPASSRAGGVVAYSSGNHAQGVAAAARLLDMPAVIVMPKDAP